MSWKRQQQGYLWESSQSDRPVRLKVDVDAPFSGVGCQCSVDAASDATQEVEADRLFAIGGMSWETVADADWMLRDNDLSMNLPYTQSRPTGAECYWRLPNPEGSSAIAMEFWFSANTRLLDEQIRCWAESVFAATQVQLLHLDGQGCIETTRELSETAHQFTTEVSTTGNQVDRERAFLSTLRGSDYHLLIAGYPGDQTQVTLDWDGQRVALQNHLNFGFLEKGVIRRTRLLAAWIPPVASLTSEVERCLQEFYTSPLPLTV